MTNIMRLELFFPFQSIVLREDDDIKLILSLDQQNNQNLSFSLDIQDTMIFRSCFSIICNILQQIPEEKFKNLNNYSIWHEKEMLRIIEETIGAAKDKPEHMIEDLNELYERKQDLENKIKTQLNYYKSNIKKIEVMRKKRYYQFQNYFGLQIASYNKKIILEVLSPNGEIYHKLEISDFSHIGNTRPGNAFVEISYQFMKDLDIIPENNKSIVVSTDKKMKGSQIETHSKKTGSTIDVPLNWIYAYQKFSIAEFLKTGLLVIQPVNITISKIELFDLIAILKERFKMNDQFIIQFNLSNNSDNRIKIGSNNSIIFNKYSEIKNGSYLFYGKVRTFVKLENIIHLVSNVNFNIFQKGLPNYIDLQIRGYNITIGFLSKTKPKLYRFECIVAALQEDYSKRSHREVYQLLYDQTEVTLLELKEKFKDLPAQQIISILLDLIYRGLILFDNSSETIRYRQFLQNPPNNNIYEIGSNYLIAGRFARYYIGNIKVESRKNYRIFSLINFEQQPQIKIDSRSNIVNISCICGNNSSNNPCVHLLGFYVAIMMEGLI